MSAWKTPELFRSGRLLAFSDGVFGVVITLLVIDVRLPPIPPGDDAAFLEALLGMERKFYVFALTFVVVGFTWLGHHRKFSYIERVDVRLLWLNLVYLMTLCLVPFASSMLAEHGTGRYAFALYAGVMAAASLLSATLSAYGLREPYFGNHHGSHGALRWDMTLPPLLGGVLFLVGAAMAMGGLNQLAHLVLVLIVPVMAFYSTWSSKRARRQAG